MVQAITNKRDWIGAFFAVSLLAGPALTVAAEDPDVEAQFQEGMDALEDDRIKSAVRAFSNILDAEPELHRAKLELALAYYRSLRYEEAQKLAQEVFVQAEEGILDLSSVAAFLLNLYFVLGAGRPARRRRLVAEEGDQVPVHSAEIGRASCRERV